MAEGRQLIKIEMMLGKLPEMVIALYYSDEDKYVGVMTRQREAIPGLLVFENIVHLTLYLCAGSKHMEAVPKVLQIEDARQVIRRNDKISQSSSTGHRNHLL